MIGGRYSLSRQCLRRRITSNQFPVTSSSNSILVISSAEMATAPAPSPIRDAKGPFQGHSLTEGEPGATPGDHVAMPSADHVKLLLELKESCPDDFRKLVKSAMGADTTEDTLDDTASETPAESEMETSAESSDGGSTVRELNRQLEDSNGIVGNVSHTTGGKPNSSHSNVNSSVNAEWQQASRKRTVRTSTTSDSESSRHEAATKRSKISDLTVFVKGVNFDVAKEASKQPLAFKRCLLNIAGPVGEVKLAKDCVRVTCLSPRQKITLLSTTEFNGKVITVTEPWSRRAPATTRPASSTRLVRGIIFGVSTELTDADIVAEANADSARRLTKWTDGQSVPTENVVVGFSGDLPQYVYLGCLRYKVKPYIPQPIRCTKCQTFGHVAANCRREVRCVRCGKGHPVDNCPIKDNLAQAVCVNCKGNHSAAFKGCSKYQQVSKALKVSVTEKLSYKDALLKVRSVDVQPRVDEEEVGQPMISSTPLPRAETSMSTQVRRSDQPPARRELFQASSGTAEMTDRNSQAERTRQTTSRPAMTDITTRDFMKGITHILLSLMSVNQGQQCADLVPFLREDLKNLACRAFGSHGSSPCLNRGCRH